MSDLATQYRALREKGGFVDLSGRAHLLFTGADRARYLNGQLTANVATVKAPCVLPACVATAKGKLCGDVFVSIAADSIVLDAQASLVESLAARLEKYIVADNVELTSLPAPLPHFHLIGAAKDALPAEFLPLLAPVNRFGIPGFDALPQTTESSPNLSAALDWLRANATELSSEVLEVVRIEQGIPLWGAELDENTFPSEAGLDRTHVDFHKGCYIGQEVISRLRSVGQANRGLHGFTADAPIPSGARIFAAADPTRDLGKITSATHSFALDRPLALGYLRRGAPETGLLCALPDSADAPVPLSIHPLPIVP